MKTMNIFFGMICVFLMTTQIIAQGPQIQTRIWEDGNPSFQRTTPDENVRIDTTLSIVSLIPTFGFYQEPADFQFILPVVDSSWSWPRSPEEKVKILLAEDIEQYTDIDGIHYVVTDKDDGKIIDLILSDPDKAWVLKGPLGEPSQTLNNPVDTYVYKENDMPIFLIADQGRHRVLKVDRYRNIVLWQYGDGNPGVGANQLRFPSDAMALPEAGQILICDQENDRVILVNEADRSIVWEYSQLSSPVDIDYDFNSEEVLITDQGNNRVIKVQSHTDVITWEYNIGLNSPTDADLLANGNVLICDKNNNRLFEVNYNKLIVWQLADTLENLADADRLLDNMHLVISNGQPSRNGYLSREFISDPRYLGRGVDFDQLFWSANTIPGLTAIQIQLRTENTVGDLFAPTTPWRGPSDYAPFYIVTGDSINPLHNGHKIYQFKATLNTSDPLYTPVLDNVRVTYKFYDTEKTGQIISETVSDPEEYIITRWDSLIFNTTLPPNPESRDKVRMIVTILDGNTNESLWSSVADQFNAKNKVALHNIESLMLVQSIKLQADFSTNTSAATPVLKDWGVKWQATPLTTSKIEFVKLVNQEFKSASSYRVPLFGQDYIDYVNVKLTDLNLLPIDRYESIDLNIFSLLTKDSVKVKLNRKTQGWYILDTSIPVIISDSVNTTDGELQVRDRDYLVVSYTDPIAPTDQASDTALVVQNTTGVIQFLVQADSGAIQIEGSYFAPIDTATIGDTIYVHISGEKDRDILAGQDVFTVVIFDDFKTSDEETLFVFELPDSLEQYSSGEFISTGIRLLASEIPVYGDSLLQTYGGSRISVKYEDTILKIPVIPVAGKQLPIPPEAYSGTNSLDFDMAPNPYYGDQHDLLRIRVASAIGNLTVEKIEIYNFAGQKITEIDGNQLKFYYDYPIPAEQYGYADGWWNLRDQSSVSVSSGTYWVKVTGKIENTDQNLSHIKKLVILK